MSNGILVLVEHQDGSPKKTAFELLTKAASFGVPVFAAVIGGQLDSSLLASYGASKVFTVSGNEFSQYQTASWSRALQAIIQKSNPSVVLGAASPAGKDLFPRVSARLNSGLASDCIELSKNSSGKFVAKRPVYSGKAIAEVEINSPIQFFTIRPNSFVASSQAGKNAENESVSVSLTDSDKRSQLVDFVKGATEKVDLTEADRIVSGGRSLGSAENFKLLEDLANVIGATVGASRAAVDAGYAGHDTQVGQTGKTVNPTLYFAFGISGAIQHLAGMRSSKVIVAVNKDADAPIFQVANYGIVGDLFQIVPALTQELKKVL